MNPIFENANLPPPFPTEPPPFIEDLKRHHAFVPHRNDNAEPLPDALPLLDGLRLDNTFPDPQKRLDTAVADFTRFLAEAQIPCNGKTPVQLAQDSSLNGEDFILNVAKDRIIISAGTTEGSRRAIYALMDRIAALQTPWLPCGEEKKRYWLKNRISRCFFGPIKRPPFNVDELMNDIDYYPDEYLSRLAQEGINGLWLSVCFRELCSTSITPTDPNAPKRIAKLRKTVEKCLRYGIKTWIFCIEPIRWCDVDNPVPVGHEELLGPGYNASLTAGYIGNMRSFCPHSKTAQKYLYEAAFSIFSQVPGLGGQITISHGERMTSCLSTTDANGSINCHKNCGWTHQDIIANTLGPMAKGMHDANPQAELISWLYHPEEVQMPEWIYHLPDKLTPDVSLAYNLESGTSKIQLGKAHIGGDYWLSASGPSDRFFRIAQATKGHCGIAAKLQVACSHEVATVPDVPVPGALYEKYRAMHDLGVEHAIQCWFFGNYPGLMNRASGMLACENFSTDKDDFLRRLAAPEWPGRENDMADIWKTFHDAYQNYPLNKLFQYYGPVHDGPVWPLHLKQVRRQMPRSWQPDRTPAGDALGEALKDHSLGEAAILLAHMSDTWQNGLKRLETFAEDFANADLCREQLTAAQALGIQFASAANIYRFYTMRDSLFNGAKNPLVILDAMENIVRDEINNSRKLADLCGRDTRLGYHSEAEIFKYFPEKLNWRIRILEDFVLKDFRDCRQALARGIPFRTFAECKDTPRCQTDTLYTNGRLSWSAHASAEDIIVTVTMKDPTDADEEFLKFYFMDESCTMPPITVNSAIARRSDECVDWSECATLSKSETGSGWQVIAKFPRAMLGNKATILFGVELLEYRDNAMTNITWPAGDFPDVLRVALSYFSPDRMALLEI